MNLIMAGEYRHAGLVANYLGLRAREWRYVSDPRKMYGVPDDLVFVYDTLEWRNDFPELSDLLERHEYFHPNSVRIITEEML